MVFCCLPICITTHFPHAFHVFLGVRILFVCCACFYIYIELNLMLLLDQFYLWLLFQLNSKLRFLVQHHCFLNCRHCLDRAINTTGNINGVVFPCSSDLDDGRDDEAELFKKWKLCKILLFWFVTKASFKPYLVSSCSQLGTYPPSALWAVSNLSMVSDDYLVKLRKAGIGIEKHQLTYKLSEKWVLCR